MKIVQTCSDAPPLKPVFSSQDFCRDLYGGEMFIEPSHPLEAYLKLTDGDFVRLRDGKRFSITDWSNATPNKLVKLPDATLITNYKP